MRGPMVFTIMTVLLQLAAGDQLRELLGHPQLIRRPVETAIR